jgi:hypothetical protein
MDKQNKVVKTVQIVQVADPLLSTDEWTAIVEILLRGELENHNEYEGANAREDIDQPEEAGTSFRRQEEVAYPVAVRDLVDVCQ